MKLKLFLLLGIFFITKSFAHKDKQIHEKYGNVKVYMRTGFEYSDISKIKLIGKLSEKISKNLKYKDTIFIEYIQDYTNQYKDNVYFLENNNSNYRFISGIDTENEIQSTNKGISVRIYAGRIKILEILKLVEYAIKNKEHLNKELSKQKIKSSNKYEYGKNHFKTIANSKKFITKIFESKTSDLLKKIVNQKTNFELKKQYGIETYWRNGEFIFEYKYLKERKTENKYLLKIKDFCYSIEIGSKMLVFLDKINFIYLDTNDKYNNQRNKFSKGTIRPVQTISRFKNKILIFNSYGNDNLAMYLINENKIITDF